MPLSKEVCLVVHSSVREFSCVCLSLYKVVVIPLQGGLPLRWFGCVMPLCMVVPLYGGLVWVCCLHWWLERSWNSTGGLGASDCR